VLLSDPPPLSHVYRGESKVYIDPTVPHTLNVALRQPGLGTCSRYHGGTFLTCKDSIIPALNPIIYALFTEKMVKAIGVLYSMKRFQCTMVCIRCT